MLLKVKGKGIREDVRTFHLTSVKERVRAGGLGWGESVRLQQSSEILARPMEGSWDKATHHSRPHQVGMAGPDAPAVLSHWLGGNQGVEMWGVMGATAGALGQIGFPLQDCFYDPHWERIEICPFWVSLLALVTSGHFLVLSGNKALLSFTFTFPRLFCVCLGTHRKG